MECKYVLTADIDLGGMEWTPIGYNFNVSGEDIKNVPFQGKFEGNGHVIKDFKITKIPHQDEIISTIEKEYEANTSNSVSSELSDISLGLFGYVNGASIRNLKVTGGLIKLDTTAAGKSFTIAGNSYTLTVKSEARVSAGLLAGSSALSYYDVYEELFRENDGNPAVLIENPDTSSGAASYVVNPDADISAYEKDMPNYIKNGERIA